MSHPVDSNHHLHTSRYSGDSSIDPFDLIPYAIKKGLHGLVITEHHHTWPQTELDELLNAAKAPGFVLLSGFEYTSGKGDVLIYGLNQDQCETFIPRQLTAKQAIAKAHNWGAVCVAAHPTRTGLGFDESITDLPLTAIEVQSCNLNTNEQRLGNILSNNLEIPPIANSDAHRIKDLGAYWTEFTCPIQSMDDLKNGLKSGQFHPNRPKT